VGDAELVAQPVDPVVEPEKPRTAVKLPEPLGKIASGRGGDFGDQVPMRFLGVV